MVFGEKNFLIFEGRMKNNSINYSDFQYFSNPARKEESIDFLKDIYKGNQIIINNNKLFIMNNSSMIKSIDKKQEWFMIDFE